MRTLLVDHETDPARVVQQALSHCGFAVDVACTLDEAAAAFCCASYDILLLELGSTGWRRLGLAEAVET
ncbi:DNA-binding response OmpR family regulator [Bradyrhizobium sp. LM2.7]